MISLLLLTAIRKSRLLPPAPEAQQFLIIPRTPRLSIRAFEPRDFFSLRPGQSSDERSVGSVGSAQDCPLGVSRPLLIRVLEAGQIPYRKVGHHRRVLMKEVLAYKQTMQVKGSVAMDELVELSEEMGGCDLWWCPSIAVLKDCPVEMDDLPARRREYRKTRKR